MQNQSSTEDLERKSHVLKILEMYGPDGLRKDGGFDTAEVISILRCVGELTTHSEEENPEISGRKIQKLRESLGKMRVSGPYFLNFGESDLRPEAASKDIGSPEDADAKARKSGFLRAFSFPSAGIYAVEGGKFFLAVKTGDNNGARKHNDTGSFVVYKEGRPMLADPGAGALQKDPGSRNTEAERIRESCFHNLPTIEGYDQCGSRTERLMGKNAAIDVDLKRKEIFPGTEGYLHSMELRGCYPEQAPIETYIREIRFISDGPIEVTEHLRLKDEAFPHWTLHFMSEQEPVWDPSENALRIGTLGALRFDRPILGVETERIDVSCDERLRKNWPDGLWRTNLAPLGGVIRYLITTA